MKRKFADLHLRLDPRDVSSASRIIKKAASLGYDLIAVPLHPDAHAEESQRMKEISRSAGLDFVSRADLRAKTRDQLMAQLRKLRRKYELICVYCESKEIARQAAKDRRVDLINFPSVKYAGRFLDKSEAELMKNGLAAWEIDVKPLFLLEGPARTRFLSSLLREVSVAGDFKIPVVLSSGATSELMLRKPMEMAALAGLFGLDYSSALEGVSTTPMSIVERNRMKLSAGFVAPGIDVIKEGNDY